MGSSLTPLMLNLVLLACVNAKEPERALGLLQRAHELEAKASTKVQIVDTISYNTVIKGFAANGLMVKCLECLETMQSHNLRPDDVTLTSLLELSLADGAGGITDRLVEMLLSRGRSA